MKYCFIINIIKISQIYIFFITLQGFPTATEPLGIFFVTTLPAHITVLSQIFTHLRIVTLAQIHTLFPIFISENFPLFEVLNFSETLNQ